MKAVIEKIDKGLQCFERPVIFISGLLLFLLMTWCVLARYFLSAAVPYQVELAQMFHIWLCFIGSSYLFSIDANPSVEIFSDRARRSNNMLFKKVYFSVMWLLSLFFIVPCFYYAVQNIPKYAAQKTSYLLISYIWIYGAGIVGFGLMIFRIILRVLGFWGGLYIEPAENKIESKEEQI